MSAQAARSMKRWDTAANTSVSDKLYVNMDNRRRKEMNYNSETDVMVVGSGAAAFSAAITAKKTWGRSHYARERINYRRDYLAFGRRVLDTE